MDISYDLRQLVDAKIEGLVRKTDLKSQLSLELLIALNLDWDGFNNDIKASHKSV
jgi:hypothetical protein